MDNAETARPTMQASYQSPRNLGEALEFAASAGCRMLAGGTDVYPALAGRPAQVPILDLSRLDGLRGLVRVGDEVRIGALTTWTALIRADLPPCFDALKAAARQVGSVQIQNRASIGGNLVNASPAADGVPPLLALGADVEVASLAGLRRMPLAEFITGNRRTALRPGELLTAVIVPWPGLPTASAFHKLGSRAYLVISVAMVAVNLSVGADGKIADARIAVGACSPVALRLTGLEAALRGKPAGGGLGEGVESRHLSALSPIDDIRASAAYRREAAQCLVRRALDDCAARLP